MRFERKRELEEDGIRLGHCSQQDAVSGRVCIGGEVKAKGYLDHDAAAAAARDDLDLARAHFVDPSARSFNKGPASQPAAAVVELHQDEPSADSWPFQATTHPRHPELEPEPGRPEQDQPQPQPQVQVKVQFQFQVRV